MAFASMSSNNEERNKEMVRQLWEDVNAGNLDELGEHPGLAEIVPTVTMIQEVLQDAGYQTQELLADGDWVMLREIMWGVPTQDLFGIKANERCHLEAISMYRVRDGKIVEQRSQVGPHEHPHPDEPGTNVPKRSGMAQKEANKALVRSVLNKGYAGNIAALEEHPGLGELVAITRQAMQDLTDRSFELKEMLADGDWVVVRALLGGTPTVDSFGVQAGTPARWEAISMFRVQDGKIVQRHAQRGPYAR
jgi:predicted ester cyclase